MREATRTVGGGARCGTVSKDEDRQNKDFRPFKTFFMPLPFPIILARDGSGERGGTTVKSVREALRLLFPVPVLMVTVLDVTSLDFANI